MNQYPHTLLQASGTAVGLLDNSMGNSEVGHQTIGAGRVIEQPVATIHHAIISGKLAHNQKLVEAFEKLTHTKGRLHIIGLLSDAGVHSHQELLYALLDRALQYDISHIYVHPIIDGRDVPPASASSYLSQLDAYIKHNPSVSIGSIHGRYYAMDRDHNWDRTEKSVRCLTIPEPAPYDSWQQLLDHYYKESITDEFVPPTSLQHSSAIRDGDGVIFFNLRPDRARQLTKSILQHTKGKLAFFITPVAYTHETDDTTVLFKQKPINNTLLDVLHDHNKHIFNIAETEKYAHITYFFNSGRETPFAHETNILIPSLKKQTYAHTPEMSAYTITQTVIQALEKNAADFYLINYANADMVGHSGDIPATIKAIEYLDTQLALLYAQIVTKMSGTMIITADHGKAEEMFDTIHHQPKTSHTTNPVPFIIMNDTLKGSTQQLHLTTIADIAPYILTLMKLPIPQEMQR